jgi:choline monooxygenase
MSDLSISLEALERSRFQLPVSSYFDEELFRREQALIFQQSPRYLGHELAVPQFGDHLALAQEGEGRALVRTAGGGAGLQRVPPPPGRDAQGRGHAGSHIVCPLHRWTYGLDGQLLGAPHFEQDPCLNLRNYPVQNWHGLLFEGNGRDVQADLAPLGMPSDFDFSGYVYGHTHLHECDYNWKTFIEVYLEDYHVGPFHPGLGQFVTCEDLRWELGAHHSVQTVGVNQALAKAGSPTYRHWQDQLLQFTRGKAPARGAVWLTYYPTVMVEWYPQVLVVSTCSRAARARR